MALSIAFAATLFSCHKVHNISAILEWLIAFLFTFYLLSFAVDLYPAVGADKGDFAVEKGYDVEGFPLHRDSNDTANRDPPAASVNENEAVSPRQHYNTMEIGRTGGATMMGTGPEAREMEQRQDTTMAATSQGPLGRNAMRHVDDVGRPHQDNIR
jgi:hypothetical protein